MFAHVHRSLRVLIPAAVAVCCASAPLPSTTPPQTEPCLVDQGQSTAEFQQFRAAFADAVRSRDAQRLKRVVAASVSIDPNTPDVSFNEFERRFSLTSRDSELWPKLERLAASAGVFSSSEHFCAPLYVCGPLVEDDSAIVLVRNTPARVAPASDAQVLEHLPCGTVKLVLEKGPAPPRLRRAGWTAAFTDSGKWAYIDDRQLGTGNELYVEFSRLSGAWAMTTMAMPYK